MNSQRKVKIVRVVAVVLVALAAGHVAQSNPRLVTYASMISPQQAAPPPSAAPALVAWAEPSVGDQPLPVLPAATPRPEVAQPVPLEAPDAAAEISCTPELSLAPADGAMIEVALAAPCHPSERIVLRHAGLAVTYRTNSLGVLSASLPALVPEARVSVLFPGGDMVESVLILPEAAGHRRFGVQWLGPQSLGVHAFEDKAGYGMPGHVSATDARRPAETMLPETGFLTVLGDEAVEMPVLAEVYTFPATERRVPVLVEAAVTEATCGTEILAQTLSVAGGRVQTDDLSVTMPGCDAVGDYLVLKNLVPDLTLAAME